MCSSRTSQISDDIDEESCFNLAMDDDSDSHNESCQSAEWWEATGLSPRLCFCCPNLETTSTIKLYTHTHDGAYPPHVLVPNGTFNISLKNV